MPRVVAEAPLEDVEAAKAAEANAEASKAANPNDASTLDLEIIRGHKDVGKQKRKGLDALVKDSSAALKRFKSEEDGSS